MFDVEYKEAREIIRENHPCLQYNNILKLCFVPIYSFVVNTGNGFCLFCYVADLEDSCKNVAQTG